MSELSFHQGWYIAYCKPCDCYTYLMARARGTNKAHHSNGVVIGIKCCRCRRKRAITAENIPL